MPSSEHTTSARLEHPSYALDPVDVAIGTVLQLAKSGARLTVFVACSMLVFRVEPMAFAALISLLLWDAQRRAQGLEKRERRRTVRRPRRRDPT